MQDRYFREINYLRLSITDRCNLRCFYCLPRQGWVKLPPEEILRYEELLHLSRVAVNTGIRKIRVTGGEPLVRRDVMPFLASLQQLPGLQEVCLTTNGVLLQELAPDLYATGLRHLNVSLDSLQRRRYREITGQDNLLTILAGLQKALELGFHPIKINCVVLKGLNDHEVVDFANLARDWEVQVRFIEFMPGASQERWEQHFLPMEEVRRQLADLGPLIEVTPHPTAGPAQVVRPPGFQGELGFISAVSQHHCATCNRLRLTADGRLRPCLFAAAEVDLKGLLRDGAPDEIISQQIRTAVCLKGKGQPLACAQAPLLSRPMVSIGG
jgi:cyclic pyranopterin phosphate synthase